MNINEKMDIISKGKDKNYLFLQELLKVGQD